jgi:DNA-binding NarL/FixJ family response regulator
LKNLARALGRIELEQLSIERKMRLRISIVDDHEVAREGLKLLLADSPIEVVGAFASGADALSKLDPAALDALLLDVRMPGPAGLVTLAKLREIDAQLPVVMLSAYDNPTYVARAVALKANDYVLKSDSRETIVEAITRAASGTTPLPGGSFFHVQRAMMSETMPSDLPQESPLTSREAQVLRHIGLGLSNKEIAKSLQISIETVKEHVQNMLRKIGASDRTDAAVRAVRLGLVD